MLRPEFDHVGTFEKSVSHLALEIGWGILPQRCVWRPQPRHFSQAIRSFSPNEEALQFSWFYSMHHRCP
jgi:hypothetical protein